ncbi:carnitine O-palmitoyltransferase 2, mitochondrial-like [Ceratitis capitata]|nr:carnitine O-palmitoyltransferase 2, mitochondrial-like [Ceratitis capitata]
MLTFVKTTASGVSAQSLANKRICYKHKASTMLKFIKSVRKLGTTYQLGLCQRSVSSFSELNKYQFLQRSKLPTLYFQETLPRLPIPKLELTIERFLAALKPISEKKVYETTLHMLSDFRTGDGAELHNLLQKYDSLNKHTSYISEPW